MNFIKIYNIIFIENKEGDKKMNNFDAQIQVDELRPEVDERELLSLARELADWLEYQLYGRVTASSEKETPLKN